MYAQITYFYRRKMSLINDFLSLIYPRQCSACNRLLYAHETHLCNLCAVSLPRSGFEGQRNNELELIFAGRVPVEAATSFLLFEKTGRVQQVLHKIKYHGGKDLAQELGKMYGRELAGQASLGELHMIIPIPLYPKKLKERGFNQSEAFAIGLSEALNIPVRNDLLLRKSATATQTRKKKFERWENVEGVFELTKPDELVNKHVLLVDDVITTGATIDAAWQCMKIVEGLKISLASIAYAQKF